MKGQKAAGNCSLGHLERNCRKKRKALDIPPFLARDLG